MIRAAAIQARECDTSRVVVDSPLSGRAVPVYPFENPHLRQRLFIPGSPAVSAQLSRQHTGPGWRQPAQLGSDEPKPGWLRAAASRCSSPIHSIATHQFKFDVALHTISDRRALLHFDEVVMYACEFANTKYEYGFLINGLIRCVSLENSVKKTQVPCAGAHGLVCHLKD